MRNDLLIATHAKDADGTAQIEIAGMSAGCYTAEQLRCLARTLKTIAIDSDQGATGEHAYPVTEVATL